MKVLIGADFVPTESNRTLFEQGNIAELFGSKLLEEIQKTDFRIFNVEVPLTDSLNPIKKKGPTLSAGETTVNGYAEARVDLASLANNHILDQGEQGVENTISVLKKNGIATVGAGRNLSQASKPFFFSKKGKKIGVYACCEHEFSCATEDTGGANPLDVFSSFEMIRVMKETCDYAIVLYHGGREHYRYPTPYQQKVMRKCIDSGANIVIAQHSHCIGCEEKYRGKTIVYGQGNFLFDYEEDECWQTGLLIELDIDENISIRYIPVLKQKNVVRLADCGKAADILNSFYERTDEISKPDAVKTLFKKEAQDNAAYYLRMVRGNTLADKLTAKVLGKYYLDIMGKTATKKCIYDVVACESHRDLLLTFLEMD